MQVLSKSKIPILAYKDVLLYNLIWINTMQDHHWYKRIGERAAKLVAGRECFFEALNCLCACCVLRLFVPAHNSVNKEWIPILVGFRNWDREWSSIVCHLTVDNVLCYTVCKFDGSDLTFWSILLNKRIRIYCWDQSLDHFVQEHQFGICSSVL